MPCRIAPLMGDISSKILAYMSDAISSQPENLEIMLVNKNAARLRQVVFAKSTHTATTGHLDDLQQIMTAFEKLVPQLSEQSVVNSSHLAKMKSLSTSFKRMRGYASIVHGINLLLNRYPGKAAREKSALLREFKKATERANLSVPRSLLSWLQEECQ